MAKKSNRHKKYVPSPLPTVSNGEAREMEAELRRQMDAWTLYQQDPTDDVKKSPTWPKANRPGINWKNRLNNEKEKIVDALLPKSHKKRKFS